MLLAQNPGGPGPQLGPFLEPGLWLTAVLLGGAILLMVVTALRRRAERMPGQGSSSEDQLGQFRGAYERGEMSADEFKRVQALLTGRIRGQPPAAPEGPKPEDEGSQPGPDTAGGGQGA
jgi:hypothetical protein